MDLLKKGDKIYQYEYNKLRENIKRINQLNGDHGVVVYTGKRAFVYFDETPESMLYVIGNKDFDTDDFSILGKNFDIIGKKANKSFYLFGQDIKNNIWKILIVSVLYFFIFNTYTFDKSVFLDLTDKLIEIISIFIGMVFVFIGFFYGDKERTIEVYKKGRCDEEFSIDRYILILAFSAISFLVFSSLFLKVSFIEIANMLLPQKLCTIILQYNVKYYFCVFLVYMSVINVLICFDALINYYLKTMRNKYLIDAVKEIIKEREVK